MSRIRRLATPISVDPRLKLLAILVLLGHPTSVRAQSAALPAQSPLEAVSPFQVPSPPIPQTPIAPPVAPGPELPALPDDGHAPRGSGSITLRLQDETLVRAFELLATQGSVNIITSAGVMGKVSLTLKDVTFEQALDVLTKVGDLAVKREGEIYYIYTSAEMATIRERERTPMVRVYSLSYIRASDLVPIIQPFLSKNGTASQTPGNAEGIGSSSGGSVRGAAMGSDGGGAAAGGGAGAGAGVSAGGTSAAGSTISTGSDTGGNSLAGGDTVIVRDDPDKILQIDEIVARLDVQPFQVLIEAVILSVQLDDTQQLGVNFGLVDSMQNVATVSGNGGLINAAAGFSPAKVLTTASAVAPSTLPRPGQLINGYLSPDQGLKFGFIDKNVSGFIRAIETINKVNVLASPRVMVLNKQRAEIQLGQRLGYRNTFTNLTNSLQTVQFLSVGTLLTLRPFVSQDGMVRMEIHPEKSTGAIDANGVPQTNTSELTTNILVPDGATIVIGGLIDSSDQVNQQGVLGLSRLPVVGPLFRERVVKANKTELIVLLTPRIINRAGLPEPMPGFAPTGPSGIPNSGPMPGPAAFARLEHSLDPLPPAILDGNPAPKPLSPTQLRDYGWIGEPSSSTAELSAPPTPAIGQAAANRPARDPGLLQTEHLAPPSPTPNVRKNRPIRDAFSNFGRESKSDLPPPPQPTSDAIGPTRTRSYTVRKGDDFATIARDQYGSATLANGLWTYNRKGVPDPNRLRPGTTLRLPPVKSLNQPSTPTRGLWPFSRAR